jgi:DNA-binding NarL/FixJ family response regulator
MTQRTRVLIADDQQPARQGLKALLTQCPEVEIVGEAANGQEVTLLVAACRPDIVLMDMQMPVVDGLAATQSIKHNWPQVKVIALTMYSQYKTKALVAGADAFLMKGCSAEALLDAILNISRTISEGHR